MSYNKWLYTSGNPFNRIDPSGWCDNKSHAPSLYRIQGCREDETYFLSVNLHEGIWSKYSSASILSSVEAGKGANSVIQIPVRYKMSLIDTGCYSGYESTQQDAKRFYMNGGLKAWEVNARSIMLEMDYSSQESVVRDAIGMAYVPYNRLAQNIRKTLLGDFPKELYWQAFTDAGQPEGELARLELMRILLSGTLPVAGQSEVGGRLVRSWMAGLNGTNRSELDYELALIIAYSVHYRLLVDTAYGAQEYRHYPLRYKDENGNKTVRPYDYDESVPNAKVLDNFYYCKDQTTFFYHRGSHRGYIYKALTTQELEARGGWPDDKYLNRLWDEPYRKLITGWPPCRTGTP